MKYSIAFLTSVIPLLLTLPAAAAPYASAVTNAAGTATFILNEDADKVSVDFDAGATVRDLGPLPAGAHTFSSAGHTSFRIVVDKNAGPGWRQGVLQQLSSDANELVKFFSGRGVAVNRNPGNGALFGRIYASVSLGGTANGRAVTEGIYVLNPDQTATALGSAALTGGLAFDAAGTESPYRLAVGADGSLFICDWSDTAGSVYMTDGNVAGGANVLGGPTGSPFPVGDTIIHGSIAGVVTEGSLAAGTLKLWVIDEDLQDDKTATVKTQLNSIWFWDSAGGTTLPISDPPVRFNSSGIGFASQTADLVRSPDGKFYKLQRRSVGNEAGVFIVGSDGVQITSSLIEWRSFTGNAAAIDVFAEAGAIDLTADGKYLVVFRRQDNALHIVPLIDGNFDFAHRFLIPTAPITGVGRDVAFDAAGNLYTISSGQALLRIYAPGGLTRATTGSDGTFAIAYAPTAPEIKNFSTAGGTITINFTATDAAVAEFRLERSTDLVTWTTDINVTFSGTSPDFAASVPGALPREFFRIRRQ